MKYASDRELPQIDGVADTPDIVTVEIINRGKQGRTLYVHVNDHTVLRIGHIPQAVEVRNS